MKTFSSVKRTKIDKTWFTLKILTKNNALFFSTANLFFAPALGDLPDLDLPDILDLPNLPTDLSYMTDLGPGIAPSVQNLPEFPEDSIPEDAEALLAAPPPPPPPVSAIPPPPIQMGISQVPPSPEVSLPG